jgi:hypothetical protein
MFDLVSVHDFYRMLIQDFDEFMEEPYSSRKAVHCAITAHHLADWVWHDKIERDPDLRARLGIATLRIRRVGRCPVRMDGFRSRHCKRHKASSQETNI